MLRNYLRITLRHLIKNKTYSFLNIFGLAIGVACAGIIFLWVEYELSYDNSFPNKDRICQIKTNQTYGGVTRTFQSTPGKLGPALTKDMPGIASASRMSSTKTLFAIGDKSIYETGFYTDSSFFPMFSIEFLEGGSKDAFQGLNSVLISEKMAKQFFGTDRNIAGRTLKVDNKEDYRITGVFKDLPVNSTLQFDWISPFAIYAKSRDWLKYWGANGPRTFVQLAPGADFNTVNRQLSGFIHSKDNTVTTQAILFAMKDWRIRNNFVDGKQSGGRVEFVRLFAIIACIILVIACINFMNLATARSDKRAREVGVRKVMGAAKGALISQFIGESLVMSVISVGLGLSIIALVLPSFNNLVDKQMGLGLDRPIHLVALVVIALFCGLVAGSYPSLYLSSFSPIRVFKGLKMTGGGATIIRKTLVVFQFTISITLLISTVLVYQQVQYIKSRDLGYDKENLLDIAVVGNIPTNFSAIRQDLQNTGLVENAALCNTESLGTANNGTGYSWDGKDPNTTILVSYRTITPEYFATRGMKIVEGRNFRSDFKTDSTNVMITETLAKLMGKGPAIGKILRSGDQPFTVVGVVKDYVYGDMYGKPDPVAFFANPGEADFMYIRIKKQAGTEEALAKIAEVMKKDNPAYPFNYSFVDDQFDTVFKSESLIGSLSKIFATLAIIISCLGLFGLSAFTAERRTREIGIRKVLGATVAGITGLLSRDFLKLVILSNLIAFPLAWWVMKNWLLNYAYRISISLWVFAAAAIAAIAIALFTISFQSIRAALSNPVNSLKNE